MKSFISSAGGFWKSRLIYDFKPFNRGRMLRFYRQFTGPGSLCFDLGAHTGNRCMVWLRLGARVVAVEPQPAFAQLLERKHGSHPDFRLLNQAVADKPGVAMFHISSMHPAISTLSREWIRTLQDFDDTLQWDRQVEVETTTLDALIAEFGRPDFCKIDVEGFEEKVLQGLSTAIKALSFEFFPTTPGRAVQCIARLGELGNYRYNWALTESFRLREETWLSAGEMQKRMKHYKGRKSGDIYAVLDG